MVSCYGYEIWRHKKVGGQAIFECKYMFFFNSFDNKSKSCGYDHENAYLYVIFHVKHKKLPFPAVLTSFLVLGKQTVNRHFLWEKAFIYQ